MQYLANVTKLAATPQGAEYMSLFPIEAENEIGAARIAAEQCAKAIYRGWTHGGPEPIAGFIQPQDDNLFLANVGECRNGVTRGCSLSILIREYRDV